MSISDVEFTSNEMKEKEAASKALIEMTSWLD